MPYGPLLLTSGRASRLLKAMGNERRLVILCHLSEREHSVNELSRLVGISQSALSQHLAKLRRDHLVRTRRSAQTVFYSVGSPEVRQLLRSLCDLFSPAGIGQAAMIPAELSREPSSSAEPVAEQPLWQKPDA